MSGSFSLKKLKFFGEVWLLEEINDFDNFLSALYLTLFDACNCCMSLNLMPKGLCHWLQEGREDTEVIKKN